jgi:hypothetical protein
MDFGALAKSMEGEQMKFLKENFRAVLLSVTVLACVHMMVMQGWGQGGLGPESPAQGPIRLRTVKDGLGSQGNYLLQTGENSKLSAAVATATLTQVVAAPAAGSLYLRGLWIEKATGTTGAVDVKYGTGTNCGTGTTTIMSLAANAAVQIPLGEFKVGYQVPAGKALCLDTDAATTAIRALYID